MRPKYKLTVRRFVSGIALPYIIAAACYGWGGNVSTTLKALSDQASWRRCADSGFASTISGMWSLIVIHT
jgi:hypothetical protein